MCTVVGRTDVSGGIDHPVSSRPTQQSNHSGLDKDTLVLSIVSMERSLGPLGNKGTTRVLCRVMPIGIGKNRKTHVRCQRHEYRILVHPLGDGDVKWIRIPTVRLKGTTWCGTLDTPDGVGTGTMEVTIALTWEILRVQTFRRMPGMQREGQATRGTPTRIRTITHEGRAGRRLGARTLVRNERESARQDDDNGESEREVRARRRSVSRIGAGDSPRRGRIPGTANDPTDDEVGGGARDERKGTPPPRGREEQPIHRRFHVRVDDEEASDEEELHGRFGSRREPLGIDEGFLPGEEDDVEFRSDDGKEPEVLFSKEQVLAMMAMMGANASPRHEKTVKIADTRHMQLAKLMNASRIRVPSVNTSVLNIEGLNVLKAQTELYVESIQRSVSDLQPPLEEAEVIDALISRCRDPRILSELRDRNPQTAREYVAALEHGLLRTTGKVVEYSVNEIKVEPAPKGCSGADARVWYLEAGRRCLMAAASMIHIVEVKTKQYWGDEKRDPVACVAGMLLWGGMSPIDRAMIRAPDPFDDISDAITYDYAVEALADLAMRRAEQWLERTGKKPTRIKPTLPMRLVVPGGGQGGGQRGGARGRGNGRGRGATRGGSAWGGRGGFQGGRRDDFATGGNREPLRSSTQSRPNFKCWNCGQNGHNFRACTEARATCTKCDQNSHCTSMHDAVIKFREERRKSGTTRPEHLRIQMIKVVYQDENRDLGNIVCSVSEAMKRSRWVKTHLQGVEQGDFTIPLHSASALIDDGSAANLITYGRLQAMRRQAELEGLHFDSKLQADRRKLEGITGTALGTMGTIWLRTVVENKTDQTQAVANALFHVLPSGVCEGIGILLGSKARDELGEPTPYFTNTNSDPGTMIRKTFVGRLRVDGPVHEVERNSGEAQGDMLKLINAVVPAGTHGHEEWKEAAATWGARLSQTNPDQEDLLGQTTDEEIHAPVNVTFIDEDRAAAVSELEEVEAVQSTIPSDEETSSDESKETGGSQLGEEEEFVDPVMEMAVLRAEDQMGDDPEADDEERGAKLVRAIVEIQNGYQLHEGQESPQTLPAPPPPADSEGKGTSSDSEDERKVDDFKLQGQDVSRTDDDGQTPGAKRLAATIVRRRTKRMRFSRTNKRNNAKRQRFLEQNGLTQAIPNIIATSHFKPQRTSSQYLATKARNQRLDSEGGGRSYTVSRARRWKAIRAAKKQIKRFLRKRMWSEAKVAQWYADLKAGLFAPTARLDPAMVQAIVQALIQNDAKVLSEEEAGDCDPGANSLQTLMILVPTESERRLPVRAVEEKGAGPNEDRPQSKYELEFANTLDSEEDLEKERGRTETASVDEVIREAKRIMMARDDRKAAWSKHQVWGMMESVLMSEKEKNMGMLGERPCAADPHRIQIEKGARPQSSPARSVAAAYVDAFDTVMSLMVKSGVIRTCEDTEGWSSAIVLVAQKGKVRVCIDYRKLNGVTIRDAYPLPNLHACMQKAMRGKFFAVFDAVSGYWQVPLAEEDQVKTAFAVPGYGVFVFTRMPFGLCNAPSTFQRFMDKVLRGLDFTLAYIDDIIVWGDTMDALLENCMTVMTRCAQYQLKLKATKLQMGLEEVTFLGHKLSHGRYQPLPETIQKIQDFPVPKTVRDVRSFLGLANFHREMMPRYAHVAEPLLELTRGGVKAGKSVVHAMASARRIEAFEGLKTLIHNAHPLYALNLGKDDGPGKMRVETDASDYALGAVLIKDDRICGYWSKTMNPAQRAYSTTEKEALAIVMALDHWRYVCMYAKSLTVLTDHSALLGSMVSNVKGRLFRWSMLLQEFAPFNIIHLPGAKNDVPDYLSRTITETDGRGPGIKIYSDETRANLNQDQLSRDDYHARTNADGKQTEGWLEKLKRLPCKAFRELADAAAIIRIQMGRTLTEETMKKVLETWRLRKQGPTQRNKLSQEEFESVKVNRISTSGGSQDCARTAAEEQALEKAWEETLIAYGETDEWDQSHRTRAAGAEQASGEGPMSAKVLREDQGDSDQEATETEDETVYVTEVVDQTTPLTPTEKMSILREAHRIWHQRAQATATQAAMVTRWPDMLTDARKIFCLACARTKGLGLQKIAYQQRAIGKDATRLNDHVSFDIFDTCVMDATGTRKILTAVDAATRFVRLLPIEGETAQDIMHAAEMGWVHDLGTPKALRTDSGANILKSFRMMKSNAAPGSEKATMVLEKSEPYQHRCNGLVERVHLKIIEQLMLRCSMDPGNWSTELRKIEEAINSASHPAVGMPPVVAVFQAIKVNGIRNSYVEGQLQQLATKLQKLRDVVPTGALLNQEGGVDDLIATLAQQKPAAKRRSKATGGTEIEVGDSVFVKEDEERRLHWGGRKFTPRFRGPFVVVGLSEHALIQVNAFHKGIALTKPGTKTMEFHVQKLRRVREEHVEECTRAAEEEVDYLRRAMTDMEQVKWGKTVYIDKTASAATGKLILFEPGKVDGKQVYGRLLSSKGARATWKTALRIGGNRSGRDSAMYAWRSPHELCPADGIEWTPSQRIPPMLVEMLARVVPVRDMMREHAFGEFFGRPIGDWSLQTQEECKKIRMAGHGKFKKVDEDAENLGEDEDVAWQLELQRQADAKSDSEEEDAELVFRNDRTSSGRATRMPERYHGGLAFVDVKVGLLQDGRGRILQRQWKDATRNLDEWQDQWKTVAWQGRDPNLKEWKLAPDLGMMPSFLKIMWTLRKTHGTLCFGADKDVKTVEGPGLPAGLELDNVVNVWLYYVQDEYRARARGLLARTIWMVRFGRIPENVTIDAVWEPWMADEQLMRIKWHLCRLVGSFLRRGTYALSLVRAEAKKLENSGWPSSRIWRNATEVLFKLCMGELGPDAHPALWTCVPAEAEFWLGSPCEGTDLEIRGLD